MRKTVRLREKDLNRLVKKILKEDDETVNHMSNMFDKHDIRMEKINGIVDYFTNRLFEILYYDYDENNLDSDLEDLCEKIRTIPSELERED